MEKQLIISVGREFGSGGHEIAKLLADHYGMPLLDRNLLDVIAKEKNLNSEELRYFDEKKKNKFLSRTVAGLSSSPEDNIAKMQFDFLKEKADEGKSFVVVGRCSCDVLKAYPGLVSMFILADRDRKKERIMRLYHLSEKEALDKMKRHDNGRKEYHNSHCQFKWGDSRGYDISINSSRLGVEETSKMLIHYIDTRKEQL